MLQAAYRARRPYHRRVQRRTSAGYARYSIASGAALMRAQFGWNRGTLLNLYVQALHPVMTDGVKRFLFSTLFKFQVEKGVLS